MRHHPVPTRHELLSVARDLADPCHRSEVRGFRGHGWILAGHVGLTKVLQAQAVAAHSDLASIAVARSRARDPAPGDRQRDAMVFQDRSLLSID